MAPRQLVVHPVQGYMIKPTEKGATMKMNKRERNRVESVNRGFEVLRQRLLVLQGKVSKVHVCLFVCPNLTQGVQCTLYCTC